MKDASITYQIISTIAAALFFIPIIILAVRKLIAHSIFIWFAAYWMLGGAINLLYFNEAFANSSFSLVIERVFNLADTPIMLFIIYKTVHVEAVKSSIKKMLPAYLCTVFMITLFTLLQGVAETMIVGVGLAIILMYIIWIISHYIKGIKYDNTEYTIQFIYYALLFEYGVSVITFIFGYIFPEKNAIQDSFLIYYLSIIISISLASYGLFSHKNLVMEKKIPVRKKEREAEIKFL